ncbi:MAG: type II toxin-antitoxin system Phd/YefM family antitoxin [Rhodospirillaceae bacterium]|nr:type II toxin-antitoxin system Phd/YefM family antitoxin [Rhodospirillaceae bacterium]
MARVSATTLQKEFGKWAQKAITEPVAIERHGRESLYLISAERYQSMRRLEHRSLGLEDISDDMLEMIEKAQYGK